MSLILPVQLGFMIFILFASSRAYLRFKGGSLHIGAMLFWFSVWSAATLAVFSPNQTTQVAKLLGIGRGVDVVVYSAIILLFYLVFRLHVYLEEIRTQLSELIREVALKDVKTTKHSKSK